MTYVFIYKPLDCTELIKVKNSTQLGSCDHSNKHFHSPKAYLSLYISQ